jgi:hypothetical protein
MLDIYEYLLIMTLTTYVSGGSYQSNNETIQTSHEWPLIYSQFLQCQLQLNGSFLLRILLYLIDVIALRLIQLRKLRALSRG